MYLIFNCYIPYRCEIDEGVKLGYGKITIGTDSFVGANAVITEDIQPNNLLLGILAEVIKERK